MVTIAIVATLLVIALPSFDSIISSNRIAAANNALVFSLQQARSEAIERLQPTAVCVSSNSHIEDAVCDADASYTSGWIAYVDVNGNGVRDTGAVEEIFSRMEPLSGAITVTPAAIFASQIYFNDSGGSTNTAGIPLSGVIEIKYGDGVQLRELTVSANGRVSTKIP